MIIACGFIAGSNSFAKALGVGLVDGPDLHPLMLGFARFIFGFLGLLLFYCRGFPSFSGVPWRLHIPRTILGWGGVTLMFAAVSLMPLADAVAISFLNPIFAMILAVVFLREFVGLWRWSAAGISLFGAVVLTQPGTDAFQPAALLALAAAVLMGAEIILIKVLTRSDSIPRTMLINNGLGAVIGGICAAFVWETPTIEQTGFMIGVGLLMVTAQLFFLNGMKRGEASFVAPFMYSTLVYAAIYGFFFFGEVPAITTGLGAALILAGAFITSWRERLAAERAVHVVKEG